jgi:predicted amidohydrolase YtcJ
MGQVIDAAEALTPEQALQLFLSNPGEPGLGARQLAVGEIADLCLLDAPWDIVRDDLRKEHVRATWVAGTRIYTSG